MSEDSAWLTVSRAHSLRRSILRGPNFQLCGIRQAVSCCRRQSGFLVGTLAGGMYRVADKTYALSLVSGDQVTVRAEASGTRMFTST